MGSWPKGKRYKEMGIYNRENTLECVQAFTVRLFTHVLGWTMEECEVLMGKVRKLRVMIVSEKVLGCCV